MVRLLLLHCIFDYIIRDHRHLLYRQIYYLNMAVTICYIVISTS